MIVTLATDASQWRALKCSFPTYLSLAVFRRAPVLRDRVLCWPLLQCLMQGIITPFPWTPPMQPRQLWGFHLWHNAPHGTAKMWLMMSTLNRFETATVYYWVCQNLFFFFSRWNNVWSHLEIPVVLMCSLSTATTNLWSAAMNFTSRIIQCVLTKMWSVFLATLLASLCLVQQWK